MLNAKTLRIDFGSMVSGCTVADTFEALVCRSRHSIDQLECSVCRSATILTGYVQIELAVTMRGKLNLRARVTRASDGSGKMK